MSDHPRPDERLIDFLDGALPPAEHRQLERELSGAPARRMLADALRVLIEDIRAPETHDAEQPGARAVRTVLAAFPAAPEPVAPRPTAGGWISSLHRHVARLVFDGRATATLAGFRGTAGGALAYESDLGRLDLDLRPLDPIGAGDWRLRGQFRGGQRSGRVALLAPGGEMVGECESDERGAFVISSPVGPHALVLEVGADDALVVDELVIG